MRFRKGGKIVAVVSVVFFDVNSPVFTKERELRGGWRLKELDLVSDVIC